MKSAIIAAALAGLAAAHGGVSQYEMDGVTYAGWQPYNDPTGQSSIERQYSSYDPLLLADLSTVNIRCNNAGALGTGPIGNVTAGTTIKATWAQWTHRPASVLVYMARCPSSGCNSWDGNGTVWFKIDQDGLESGTAYNGTWAGDHIVDTLTWTSTVPASLAPGQYLIRHELIAVHQANNPQFYPECAQLVVTGSGADTPSGSFLVAFPGAYQASDPGLEPFDIYSQEAMTETCYPIPGPAVWPSGETVACASSGSGSASSTTTTAPAGASTGVSQWGQCGGIGYSGSTTCAGSFKCVVINDYYSQCQ